MPFRELRKLNRFIDDAPDFVKVEVLETVDSPKGPLPIHGIVIGPDDPTLPTFGLFGGVHGQEKIGSHVVINHLKYIARQTQWDKSLQELFKKIRLVSIPIINPAGMSQSKRHNPNGVDLMRNAPLESPAGKYNLLAGHYYTNKIPWYRGRPYEQMEKESIALINFVKKEIFPSCFTMTLDVHSGFGFHDRFWTPYSKDKTAFPEQALADKFWSLYNESLAHNRYVYERKSDSYLINGDLWDYLYEEQRVLPNAGPFIPWTLEIGSWRWVKKNLAQIFHPDGLFNPVKGHRYDRVMREHRMLLDFFQKSIAYHSNWSQDL